MSNETKMLSIIIAAVVLLLGGAAFFASSSNPLSTSTTSADPAVLIRKTSDKKEVPNAKVTIVEFGDYQCPACSAVQPLVKKILAEHKGKITYVFRNYPLPQHPNAQIAAEAAEAAGAQGKYWEMHDLLFEKQAEWSESTSPLQIFVKYATSLKLNTDRFQKEVKANKYEGKIRQDMNDGNALAINQTPTFFVNGEMFTGQNGDLAATVKGLLKP
ncbi:MAG: thioredoxin domain-containing protein [Patescibacteria group bacterium]|jgi:protein-disulfide isomerase